MAKVSICIPTYNNVGEVEHLLRSVYEQDYMDFEVNLSDDSTNGEIEQLMKLYPQVHYVHNKKPLGHIFNWNAAIQMAAGEYIKIMFSDDWFTDSTSLGGFVRMLDENPKANLAFSGSRQVLFTEEESGAQVIKRSYQREPEEAFLQNLKKDYRLLFCGNQIGAPSASIYRRGETLALFDEKSNWASDMFLYFDILQENPEFAFCSKPLISIGVHEKQYTESFSEKDMRIYQDYRYLYTKYNLQESRECQEYFLEKFLIRYHQGIREAKKLQIGGSLYWRKWFEEQRNTIRCFVNHRFGKAGD